MIKKSSIMVLISLLVVFILGYVVATEIYTITTPGTVSVIGNSEEVDIQAELYFDAACTQPANYIDFGEIMMAGDHVVTVYLKNTGTGTIYYVDMLIKVYDGLGTEVKSTHGWFGPNIAPGDAGPLDLQLSVGDLSHGVYPLEVVLECSG